LTRRGRERTFAVRGGGAPQAEPHAQPDRGDSLTTGLWRVGSKLAHPFDPELGVGVVRLVDGRYLHVWFPSVDRELVMAAEAGLQPFRLRAGSRAHVLADAPDDGPDALAEIAEVLDDGYTLADGRRVAEDAVWPVEGPETPVDRVANLDVDPVESFRNRLDGLELCRVREAGGLGPFLGGRIELYPHQLHTALHAIERDPVRWLLADEVGLGKTIEAGLILSALIRTRRAERAIVIVPEMLAVQWLGELYRKFHQVFTLLDDARLENTARDFGPEFNPFDAHANVVIARERLESDHVLCQAALEAEPDTIVIDEAHRLCHEPAGPALAPLVRAARHALLLTATPLYAGLPGLHGLLELLHPAEIPPLAEFEAQVASGRGVLPCTSAVRRQDLGGLPARVPAPVDLERADFEARVAWLCARAPEWESRGEKALVFVAELEEMERVFDRLVEETGIEVGVFHERMALDERDIQLARFQESTAPVLLCSEAGSEGRNFQFCDRMLHFDLPDDPQVLEQRIGRLDRIGRTKPVEICYFRAPDAAPDLAGLYERLGLFSQPAAAIDAALAGVRQAVESARSSGQPLDVEALAADAVRARGSAERHAPRAFYPDAYDPSKADAVRARVPRDLDARMQRFCLGAAEDLGLIAVPKGGVQRYYLEFGSFANVDSLPGVGIPGTLRGAGQADRSGQTDEVRFLGTFDRAEAVQHQSLAFFSSGQMLVEGLILELEDGARGRAALLEIAGTGQRAQGLLCVYRDGPQWSAVAVDIEGRVRPELAGAITSGLARARPIRPPEEGGSEAWQDRVRALGERAAEHAAEHATLDAAAWFRLS